MVSGQCVWVILTGRSNFSLCRRYSVVQDLLGTIAHTGQNITDGHPRKDRTREQSVFSISLLKADLYCIGDLVPSGPRPVSPKCQGFTPRHTAVDRTTLH
jgi:hypothetical protein